MGLSKFVASPYVAAHSEYSSLLGRTGGLGYPVGERIVYSLTFDTGARYTSPLVNLHQEILYQLPRRWSRCYFSITYLRYTRGRPVSAVISIPLTPRVLKAPVVDFSRLIAQYPSTLKHLRRRVADRVQQIRASRNVAIKRSTNLRPNPEIITRPFIETMELQGGFGPGPYTRVDTLVPLTIYSRTWSGVRTPNFRTLKPGHFPVNPLSVQIKDVTSNYNYSISCEISNPNSYDQRTRRMTTLYLEPGIFEHNAQAANVALRKLIDKANLGIDANLAQDLAQFSQTNRLISHNAIKIVRSVKQLRKGNFAEAAKTLTAGRPPSRIRKGSYSPTKSLADNWLELQYGWKPLLMDIDGVLKALPTKVESMGFVQRVTGSGKVHDFLEIPWQPAIGAAGQDGKYVWFSNKRTTTCRFSIRYRLASPLKAFFAQTGFTNPINLAWEILPFSFVADWFLPIGPYLEAFTAFDGLEFLEGSKTLFTKGRTVLAIDNEQITIGNPSLQCAEHGQYISEQVRLDRIRLSSFPSPTFPSLKNGLKSVTHAANAIALIKSIFS